MKRTCTDNVRLLMATKSAVKSQLSSRESTPRNGAGRALAEKRPVRKALKEPSYSLLGKYRFCGEEFLIDERDDQIILHHARWSLAGAGRSVREAEQDLAMRAKVLFHAYSEIPKAELSEDANEMVKFLRTIS
jgi:hypothetical protein